MATSMGEKDLEKVEMVEITNKYAKIGISDEDAIFFETYPEEARNKLIRKVDWRLVPILSLLYLCAHIDRANIGNAKIEGLTDDLKLSGIQYNIALSIFFIPYILLEVPSNVLLKRFKHPSYYLGMLVISWGLVMTFTGLVTNFTGLMICRVLLGIAEAGFFPGAIYLITFWYSAKEIQLRMALFYCASALSGAFSGFLAFAIAKMDGVGGKAGWAWIFLLEGSVTVLIGIACFFCMPDSPELATKWLTPEEIKYLYIQRTIKNGGKNTEECADKFKWTYLRELVTDYKVYLQAWILFTASVCAYGLKFTMPSITKAMGYSSSQAQLLTVPPYVAGAVSAIAFSKAADKVQWRMPFVVVPMAVILTGFAILSPLAPHIKQQVPACYIGVMLICIGQYPTNPAGSAWISSNLAGDMKRSMGIALNIALGNSGGLLGSYMFLDAEKPGYKTGFAIGLALAASCVVSTLVLEYAYWRANTKRDLVPEDDVRARYTDDQLARMGDRSPLFRYKL